jgi:glycosyltransferase involved in cell wall biosynthesis
MKKIVHIVVGLGDGGAEAVLYRLCLNNTSNSHTVISIMGDGKYGPLLRDIGVNVISLNGERGSIAFKQLYKIYSLIKSVQPDIVQTWLYHADFIGGLLAKLAGVKRIIWGVHHTVLDPYHSKLSTRMIARTCAVLSYILPEKIVYVAKKGKEVHEKLGYHSSKSVVIPNGYDLSVFKESLIERIRVREEFSISEDEFILCNVARFDPFKDHENLLSAYSKFIKHEPNSRLMLVGSGIDLDNEELVSIINKYSVYDKVILLGQRSDVSSIMNAADLHVLSSNSEAFPNVICEAMASGTPCLSTDVGDARYILDNDQMIVPIKDSDALADGIKLFYSRSRSDKEFLKQLKGHGRNRVETFFSLEAMVSAYEKVWRD